MGTLQAKVSVSDSRLKSLDHSYFELGPTFYTYHTIDIVNSFDKLNKFIATLASSKFTLVYSLFLIYYIASLYKRPRRPLSLLPQSLPTLGNMT